MRMFVCSRYHIKESFKGLFRNRLVNTAAIGLLIACLVITGVFGLLMLNINKIIEDLGAVNEISIFLEEHFTTEESVRVGDIIGSVENISEYAFVSKEEGLESLREIYGSLIDGLENDNPIRDSFRIIVKDQSLIAQTASVLESIEGVAKVNYRGDVADRFLQIRNMVALIGLAFIAVLALLSIAIISNSIRISAFTRREEIAVMKTVGATNRFIRASFVLEGLFIGIFGAALSFVALYFLYTKVFYPAFGSLSFIKPIDFISMVTPIAIFFGVAGPIMGLCGSALALRKYLKN